MEFDLLPFAVEALGYNQKIYKDIDRLYQTRKYDFYRAAKAHELYTHQIVTEGALLQEEYCKKALGILLYASGDEELAEALSAIFRKGWTYAYLFVQNNAQVDLKRFMGNVVKKAGGIDKVSDDWLNAQIFVVYFLALSAGKPIVENDLKATFERMLVDRWNHYREDDPTRISLSSATPERLAQVKDLKRRIFAEYGRFVDFKSMYGLFGRAEKMALLFDFERLSCESVFNTVEFSECDIEEILLAYGPPKEINLNHAIDFLVDAMYVRYMAKAYNEVKRRYFANNKETAYIELEGLEKDLSAAKGEISRLSGLLSGAQDENKQLEREIPRLKAELAEETKNRQELNSLREFLFSLDRQEEYEEAVPYDLAELKNLKAVLVGGHEKWQARMKGLLPGFIFIHPDNMAFDLRLLDGVDIIFIYTQYISHAIYQRVMSASAGKRIGYLNQPNEARVLQDIARFIKS